MKIIFVRHGELDGENPDVLHGVNDAVALSNKGKEMMRALGRSLKGARVDIIISSSETRTKESAEILSEELGVPAKYRDELQGRKWGALAGRSWGEIGPILDKKPLAERYEYIPSGGESWKEFEERMLRIIEEITLEYTDKTICIVSHGSSIRVLLPKVFGVPVEESLTLYPYYGSVSMIEFDGTKYANPLFNYPLPIFVDCQAREDKIKEIISEQLDVPLEKVTPLSNFKRDFEADELDLVEIAMALENEFGVEISEEDADNVRSVFDFVRAVEKALAKERKRQNEK
jgi:acyl carrier protein